MLVMSLVLVSGVRGARGMLVVACPVDVMSMEWNGFSATIQKQTNIQFFPRTTRAPTMPVAKLKVVVYAVMMVMMLMLLG